MTSDHRAEQELSRLLALAAEAVDLARCSEVDERYRRSYAGEDVAAISGLLH